MQRERQPPPWLEAQRFVHQVFLDTLSDAKEINELKAELAVLRSDLNDLKHRQKSPAIV